MLNFWLGFGRGRCIGRNLKEEPRNKPKNAFSGLDLSLPPYFNLNKYIFIEKSTE